MKNLIKISIVALMLVFISGNIYAQDHGHMNATKKMQIEKIVKKADMNNDGIVYQCPKCYSEFSDAPGECPECGEELKKETCDQAIELYHKHVIDKNDDAYVPEDESEQIHVNSLLKGKKINVEALDKNHDGYVYQCSMCGNEISDTPGNCPKCGMKMQKVDLMKAKTNLQKYYNEHADDSNDDAYIPESKKK